MAVLIQRDTNKPNPNRKKPAKKQKKGRLLDTLLLYIVGFFGLFGSIYLLHLSNKTTHFTPPSATPTSLLINDIEAFEAASSNEQPKTVPAEENNKDTFNR